MNNINPNGCDEYDGDYGETDISAAADAICNECGSENCGCEECGMCSQGKPTCFRHIEELEPRIVPESTDGFLD